jgi:hypothetical protein
MRVISGLLAKQGYTINAQLPPFNPNDPPGFQVKGEGQIGFKQDISFDINCRGQFYGIMGKDNEKILHEIVDFKNLINESKILSDDKILFYEYQGKYMIIPKEDSLKIIKELTKDLSISKEISEIFNQDLSPSTIRLITPEKGPESTDYYDIWIEPIFSLHEINLIIKIIYRSSNFKEFSTNMKEMEKRIEKLGKAYFI